MISSGVGLESQASLKDSMLKISYNGLFPISFDWGSGFLLHSPCSPPSPLLLPPPPQPLSMNR